MRRCYLVSYDIRDSKRLHRVFKIMKGYGEHWQYSIFFCYLKDIDLLKLQSELEKVMNLKDDQALIIDLGEDEEKARRNIRAIGIPLSCQYENSIVI